MPLGLTRENWLAPAITTQSIISVGVLASMGGAGAFGAVAAGIIGGGGLGVVTYLVASAFLGERVWVEGLPRHRQAGQVSTITASAACALGCGLGCHVPGLSLVGMVCGSIIGAKAEPVAVQAGRLLSIIPRPNIGDLMDRMARQDRADVEAAYPGQAYPDHIPAVVQPEHIGINIQPEHPVEAAYPAQQPNVPAYPVQQPQGVAYPVPQPDAAAQQIRQHNAEAIDNHGQSVHTQSVHRSVDESLIRLQGHYQLNQGSIDQAMAEMMVWRNTLASAASGNEVADRRDQAAARFLDRLNRGIFDGTTAGTTGYTMRHVVALAWHVVNDTENQRTIPFTPIAGRETLAQALYETQRGYNLTEDGVDRGGPDNPTCAGGSTNKIVAVLQPLNPLIEVRFLTRQFATMWLLARTSKHIEAVMEKNDYTAKHLVSDFRQFASGNGVSERLWRRISEDLKTSFHENFSEMGPLDVSNIFINVANSKEGIQPGNSFTKVFEARNRPASSVQTATTTAASNVSSSTREVRANSVDANDEKSNISLAAVSSPTAPIVPNGRPPLPPLPPRNYNRSLAVSTGTPQQQQSRM